MNVQQVSFILDITQKIRKLERKSEMDNIKAIMHTHFEP